MTTKNFLITLAIFSFLFVNVVLAETNNLPNPVLTPDSPFYFLKTWKESIQTFFTFGAENKTKQYLRLAEVRLAEYQKMVEKGKTEIADKILQRYEKQLNNALEKTEELKNKGRDIKDLSQKIEETVVKHLEILQENFQKVPEQAKKGIENAIENSQKYLEKILELKDKEKTPISEELKKLNIQVIGQPKQIEFQLPSALTSSNWGLKKTICEEGGYNLSLYVGESVLLTSYAINERFENESLDAWIISKGDKIACVYKSVREDSILAPGIFSVKDQRVKKEAISSFEECAKLYPVLESYPRKCKTSDGKTFTEKLEVNQEELYQCTSDNDCVSVKSGCCGCTEGGSNTAINNEHLGYWQLKLVNECKETACAQVMSDDWTCFATPKCVEGKCQIIATTSL